MMTRLGEVIYWVCVGIAGLIIAFVWLTQWSHLTTIGLLAFTIPAILVWAFGRACLYVLAGRGRRTMLLLWAIALIISIIVLVVLGPH
jgi:hypothetical protein